MVQQSSLHAYLNSTKQRLDEMDATLASIEPKAGQLQAGSKAKADQVIVDMKKRRDEFQMKAESQALAAGAAMDANKAQMEAQRRDFEAEVKTYFDTVGKQAEQQRATFLNIAAAQAKAWREAVDMFHAEAGKIAAARRTDLDAAVKQMKADAAAAQARFYKLIQAGSESWAGLARRSRNRERLSIEPIRRREMRSRAPRLLRPPKVGTLDSDTLW